MARKVKLPPAPPSKAYLVSFGDTMTALLAFFIVLNSFAQEQTGADMYSGTGSFVNAVSSIGLSGAKPGNRTNIVNQKVAPAPVYAVASSDEKKASELGPDEDVDEKRVIDRQSDEFKRFLTEINRRFDVVEQPPIQKQIVFDSFEKFNRDDGKKKEQPLRQNAIEIASEAISKLSQQDLQLEIVVWANMPSRLALRRAMERSIAIEKQIESSFMLTPLQRSRLSVAAKPWLFSDAKRPKMSFVLSVVDEG